VLPFPVELLRFLDGATPEASKSPTSVPRRPIAEPVTLDEVLSSLPDVPPVPEIEEPEIENLEFEGTEFGGLEIEGGSEQTERAEPADD
jgi:hypothetical protein